MHICIYSFNPKTAAKEVAADPRETSFFRALNLSEGVQTPSHRSRRSADWDWEHSGRQANYGGYISYIYIYIYVCIINGIQWVLC